MPKRTFRLSDSRPDARRDVDDELAFHLEMRTREFMEQGLPADEARRRAMASFGDVQSIQGDLKSDREQRNAERLRRDWWDGARMDIRGAVRSLRRNRAFSIAAIATLALGFGATVAVFTVVNGVLLRPLPYPAPERLALVWMTMPERKDVGSELPLASGFYSDLEREQRGFEAIAAFRSWPSSLAGEAGSAPEPVAGARVSPELFTVLGVRPFLGQAFTAPMAQPGAPKVAILSHALWQRRFGEDGAIVGKQIQLNAESFTVLGVMPAGFSFPRGAELPGPFQFGLRTDVWTPLVFDSTDVRNYGTQNLCAVGRVNPASGIAGAQADANNVIGRFLRDNAPNLKLEYRLVPMSEQSGRGVRRGLLILLGAVSFLLLIACANVANLLIARANGRQRELAVRAALGAGRGRIARQLVTENLVLAVIGAALGVALSYWGTKVMLSLVPGSMPRADDIGLDWRVLLMSVGVAIAAGVAFGLAAAYSTRARRLTAELHSGDTRSTGGLRRKLGRQLLVATEIALSVIMLIGAALLTRSFIRLQRVPPGFEASNVLTAGVGVPIGGRFDPLGDGPRWASTLNDLTARLAAAPGVVAVGAVSSLPLSGAYEGGGLRITGRPPDQPGMGPNAQYGVVTGDYFRAMGIRLIDGRAFDTRDDAPGAATIIVNREFARRYFPNAPDVVGRTVTPLFTFTPASEYAIVGVVDNVKQTSLDAEPRPQVYVRESQLNYPGLTFVMRTTGDPLASLATLKREARAVDPAITITDVHMMQDVLDRSLARQRFSMMLIGVFAACALVLSVVGLYGVIALIVGQRRREIGVRLALGARPAQVIRMVLGESTRLGVVGVGLGVIGAFALTRVMRSLLYDVSTTDSATFVVATLVVMAVSVAAGLVPARRAARTDPTVTLRAD